MDKLGLKKEDLGGAAGGDVAGGGGVDPNRGLASSSSNPSLDALFPTTDKPGSQAAKLTGNNGMKLSSEIQAALDKNGITSRSLFEMVHSQYQKKTPVMFGVQQKGDGTLTNPFTEKANF
jgi:hypothetical protein